MERNGKRDERLVGASCTRRRAKAQAEERSRCKQLLIHTIGAADLGDDPFAPRATIIINHREPHVCLAPP